MNNLVSICIPIYNAEKYLKRCVDSLLTQTYRNLEVVLVNDGSTDSSGSICEEYARLDSRVVVVHKDNGGEASARNAGLRTAKGDYIMFSDNDDEYLPDAVELMTDAAKSNEVDLVIGGYLEREGQTEHFATGHLRKYSAKEAANSYLSSDFKYGIIYIISTVNGMLYRNEIIKTNSISFDERFIIGNDMVFNCEYLKHTRTVYDVFAPVYVYYKFHPEERVQQTACFYPDNFFLFAYVADKMIKIAQPDENEFKQLVIKQYKYLLYGLVNASVNREHFKNGLMPYLTTFCNEIDLLRTGARLDLTENYIKKEEGALPIRLISYLIVNKRFNELYEMLKVIGKAKSLIPHKGEQIRQMIKVVNTSSKNQGTSGSDSRIPVNTDLFSGNCSFTDDELLVEQVNELVTTISALQRQIAACEDRISDYETKINDCEAKINEYEAKISDCEAKADAYEIRINDFIHSESWRITKPFRKIMRWIRK